jgi:CubicO group peptidase (beta-lactamase class C family)
MKRVGIFFWGWMCTALLLTPAAVANAQDESNPNPNPALDALIAGEMDLENFPGVAAVIVKDARVVFIKGYGFADIENGVEVNLNTAFLLASVSKLFTGMAGVHLSQSGGVDLDADINDILPFSVTVPAHPAQPITLRQLMTHTGSIVDNFDVMDTYYDQPDPSIGLGEVLQRYLSVDGADYDPSHFLTTAPGTTFEYANMGTALSGFVTEVASGMAFSEYCETHLFEPMCMETTGWYYSDFQPSQVARPYSFQNGGYTPYEQYGFADYPSGQLRSTALDLSRFMITMLSGGTFYNETVLTLASVEAMLSPQIPTIEPALGLNWYQEELFHDGGSTIVWGHNGGEQGVSTDLYIDPATGIGVCVLTNGEGDAIYIADALYNYALTLDPATGFIPGCMPISVDEHETSNTPRTLVKLIDYLGREVEWAPNTPMIKVYSDGSIERVIWVE